MALRDQSWSRFQIFFLTEHRESWWVTKLMTQLLFHQEYIRTTGQTSAIFMLYQWSTKIHS